MWFDSYFHCSTCNFVYNRGFFALVAIQASTIGFTSHPIDIAISFIIGLPNFGGIIRGNFALACNVISLVAFNIILGAVIKFIAYKIYPSVQTAYNTFFSFIKAGTKDTRANNDVALSKNFAKKAIQTNFNIIPLEMFSEIMQNVKPHSALQMRLSCKGLFTKISNRDILEKKIARSFNIAYNKDNRRYEIPPELLNLFYNYSLHSSLIPYHNFYFWRPKVRSIAHDSNETTRIIDYCIANTNTVYWIKSNLIGDLILVKKNNDNKITFTNRYIS